MKKLLAVALSLFVVTGFAFAQVNLSKVKDGVYFAEMSNFAPQGWKDQVVLEVSGGKIVRAVWNGVSNIAGAVDKDTYAASGKYGMIKASKIKQEWNQEAKTVADWLVKTQDINFSKIDSSGHTDAISGATFTVSEFFQLAKEALASAPVEKGPYKDGWWYYADPTFDKSGWKETMLVTVVNGSIVDALWNAIPKDPNKKSKILESQSGGYKMGAKQGEWYVQAARLDAAIVKAGDPSKIALDKNGNTDAVSGVTIHANAITLAEKALANAK